MARPVVHLWALGEHPNAVIRLLWGQFPRMRGVPVVDEDDYCLEYVGSLKRSPAATAAPMTQAVLPLSKGGTVRIMGVQIWVK